MVLHSIIALAFALLALQLGASDPFTTYVYTLLYITVT